MITRFQFIYLVTLLLIVSYITAISNAISKQVQYFKPNSKGEIVLKLTKKENLLVSMQRILYGEVCRYIPEVNGNITKVIHDRTVSLKMKEVLNPRVYHCVRRLIGEISLGLEAGTWIIKSDLVGQLKYAKLQH